MLTGSGEYTYEVLEDWAKFPESLGGFDVLDVGFDARGRLYAFNYSEQPLLILDRDGSFLHGWGTRTLFPNPHGVTMGPDETIWLTDKGNNTVRQFTYEGELLRTIGRSGFSAPAFSGLPFNQCTHVAIDPNNGCLYVSDGYVNAAVHKYSPEGELLMSWGEPGNKPGQFCLPHNVVTDRDGFVYVADRHNARVQVFTSEGKLEHIWYGMALPCGLHIDMTAPQQIAYVLELSAMSFVAAAAYGSELGSPAQAWVTLPGIGHRVSIRTLDGALLAELLDNGVGTELGQLIAPHGIAADHEGNIAVAELPFYSARKSGDADVRLRNITRLQRLGS